MRRILGISLGKEPAVREAPLDLPNDTEIFIVRYTTDAVAQPGESPLEATVFGAHFIREEAIREIREQDQPGCQFYPVYSTVEQLTAGVIHDSRACSFLKPDDISRVYKSLREKLAQTPSL